MAFGSPRLIFVVAILIQCVLWSTSTRYSFRSQSLGALQQQGGASLVRRWYYGELEYDPLEKELECRPLAFPTTVEQCKHVRENCPGSDTILAVPYLQSYFCTEPALRPLMFGSLLTWLLFLFSTLGISASDFFTPNLATISQLLGLDENVAGVTFLAFGNGSPDVFSTFSAMRAQSGGLAVGELLGAATFIVSCVVGSMCIIKPFTVIRGPFLRDVGFFTIAVALLLVVLSDHIIHPWEAWALVILYIVYVVVVVVGSWWERRQEKKQHMESVERSEYAPEDTLLQPAFEPYRDDPSTSSQTLTNNGPTRARAVSFPGPLRRGVSTDRPESPDSQDSSPLASPSLQHPPHVPPQMPSFSLLGALEFRQVVASLQNQAASSSLNIFDSTHAPYAGGHYRQRTMSLSRSRTVSFSDSWDAALGLPLNDRSPPQLQVTRALSDEPDDYHDNGSEFPRLHSSESDGDSESQQIIPQTRWQRVLSVSLHAFHTLCPSLRHFWYKPFFSKIASIFAVPAVLALTLTLPIVVIPYESRHVSREKLNGGEVGRLIDFEEEGIERTLVAEEEVEEELHDIAFNKWLMAAQCVFGPLFCVGILFSGSRHHIWLLIAAAISGFAAAILVVIFADKGDHVVSRMARSSMGFLVAIVWIMAIADEVVIVLQTFGFIFGLSDAIIGLTIFAIGNSLADLVANTSVAVFAPIMGFSACFGGPMLNILLGIGVSGSYIIYQSGEPYRINFSDTLVVSSVGLLTLLVATLVFVPWHNYLLTKQWGIFLIASYSVIMALNIVVELRG